VGIEVDAFAREQGGESVADRRLRLAGELSSGDVDRKTIAAEPAQAFERRFPGPPTALELEYLPPMKSSMKKESR